MEQILDLFPPNAALDGDGMLQVGGCRLDHIAEEFGTPVLLVDEDGLASARPGVPRRVPLAVAADARRLRVEGVPLHRYPAGASPRRASGLDVAGGGEILSGAGRRRRPGDVLVLHGNAKSSEEIALAVEHGVGLVVVDNFDDIDRLEAHRAGRADPGLPGPGDPRGAGVDTHAPHATGHAGSKFGLMPDDARRAIARIEAQPAAAARGAAHPRRVADPATPRRWPPPWRRWPARRPSRRLRPGRWARRPVHLRRAARRRSRSTPTRCSPRPAQLLPEQARLIVEPGRSMVARSATRCTGSRRSSAASRPYVAVDGGMGDNLEVSLTGQRFEATIADRLAAR